jgi:hypothetical protein
MKNKSTYHSPPAITQVKVMTQNNSTNATANEREMIMMMMKSMALFERIGGCVFVWQLQTNKYSITDIANLFLMPQINKLFTQIENSIFC